MSEEFKVGDWVRLATADELAVSLITDVPLITRLCKLFADGPRQITRVEGAHICFQGWEWSCHQGRFRKVRIGRQFDSVKYEETQGFPEALPSECVQLGTDADRSEIRNSVARYLEEKRARFTASDPFAPPAPTEHQARKDRPMFTGCVSYFPDALAEIARMAAGCSKQHGHNTVYWEFAKSADHSDCLERHNVDHDELDTDGFMHDLKVGFRALARIQTRLEKADPILHAKRQAQRDRAKRGERG